MLDFHRLQDQLAHFSTYHRREEALRARRLERARQALAATNAGWEALREKVVAARPKWLVAGLRSAPGEAHTCGPRPTPVTVVATDGSQIFPDRHIEPTCYLLNVSRIAFQYGTDERPLMEAVPELHYRRDELDDLYDPLFAEASTEVVSALRDEIELRELLGTAKAVRLPGRPLVALADGTLIRWMIRRMQNRDLEQRLIERYTEILAGFREERLPLCSYISMPANTEVVNLLRVFLDEPEVPAHPEQTLAGLTDRCLFEAVLPPGTRSATFESASHIQREYGEDRICYFYLHVPLPEGGGEIGRVELPAWVADEDGLLDLVHAVVLSECRKGNGYPMILSEAHERAVIRAHEKALFYEMMEREMRSRGMHVAGSRKQAAKRRPVV